MNDKKLHIINVAIDLFAHSGFEGTSMRDLANAAGVNIAMINYYFGTKEKLFETIVETRSNIFKEFAENILNDNKLSSIQKMDKLIDYQTQRVIEQRHFHKVLQNEILLNKRVELNRAIGNIFKKNSKVCRAIIEEGYKNKEFKKVDSGLVVATIFGTLHQVFLSRVVFNVIFENADLNEDPFTDPRTKKKVSDYMKQLMHSYLLKE